MMAFCQIYANIYSCYEQVTMNFWNTLKYTRDSHIRFSILGYDIQCLVLCCLQRRAEKQNCATSSDELFLTFLRRWFLR